MLKTVRTSWSVTAAIGVGSLALGAIAAHLAARWHHWHPNYGDVPTWLGGFMALAAAAITLRQLQLLGRSQRQADRVAIRRQAEEVGVRFTGATLQVDNSSPRPIRSVDVRLYGTDTHGARIVDPEKYGVGPFGHTIGLGQTYAEEPIAVLPRQHAAAFSFPVPDPSRYRFVVRFVDDADIAWEVDSDLHLRQPVRGLSW